MEYISDPQVSALAEGRRVCEAIRHERTTDDGATLRGILACSAFSIRGQSRVLVFDRAQSSAPWFWDLGILNPKPLIGFWGGFRDVPGAPCFLPS